MSRRVLGITIPALALWIASPAWAIKYTAPQPWFAPNGAVDSRILTCTAPNVVGRIALDDFICTSTGPITKVRWWGVLPNGPAQRFRPYYIRFWSHTISACTPCGNPNAPVSPVYCVQPSSVLAGYDCLNRQVWRFTANLSPAFIQTAGTHYWLQISEVESNSITAGIDFRWSGYRPVSPAPRCPAVAIMPGPVFACSITTDCPPPQPPTDLSFQLFSTIIAGVILQAPTLPLPPPVAMIAEIRQGQTGSPPLQIVCVEPDEDGHYVIEHDLPDGDYLLTLRGMGMAAQTQAFMIQDGMAEGVDFGNLRFGDGNNDGLANGMDMQWFVMGLLAFP